MSEWRYEADLRELPEAMSPEAASLRRVRARLGAPPARDRRWRLAMVAAAAVAALAWLALRTPADLPLDSPQRWSEAEFSHGVGLRFQGQGLASRGGDGPVVRWDSGEISLDVPHGQGLRLRVVTPEAEILDVGTRFSVWRDTRGTSVAVDEGRVSVTCIDGTARFLVEGQRLDCPRSAASTLSLVRERQEQGAPAAEQLELLQRALARADADPAVRDELRYLSVGALEALGYTHEARQAAEEALAIGEPPRWRALAATAARLAVAEGDCAAALPWLRKLSADSPDPVAEVMRADCLVSSDPSEARAALQAALQSPLSDEQRLAVVARLKVIDNSGGGH